MSVETVAAISITLATCGSTSVSTPERNHSCVLSVGKGSAMLPA